MFAFINCAPAAQKTSHFNMKLVDFWYPHLAQVLDITKARFGGAKSQRSLLKQAKSCTNISFWIGIYPLYPFGLGVKYEYYFRNLDTLLEYEGDYAGSTEYKTFIKFGGALVQTNANFTFSDRFVIKARAVVCPSIRLSKVYFEGYK